MGIIKIFLGILSCVFGLMSEYGMAESNARLATVAGIAFLMCWAVMITAAKHIDEPSH